MEQAKQKPTITTLIVEYLQQVSGHFSINDVYRVLNLNSPKEKNAARVALSRLVKGGALERYGTRDGIFRRPEKHLERMDFINASTKGIDIWLPLDLHKMVKLMPGEIMVIAGAKSAGKTTMALNIAWANRDKWNINYFNSEMGPSSLKNKLSFFEKTDLMEWAEKISFYSRKRDFQDVVKTGDNYLNIIDYLEATEDFWLIGAAMSAIHEKIVNTKANVVICIQKPESRDLALGGRATLDKAMLYLAVNKGNVKIVDAKNWTSGYNPNDMECTFKLVHGSEILPHSNWEVPMEKKKDKWGAL